MANMDSKRYKIMLVDDNMANLSMGKNLLRTFYEVFPVSSAKKLFELLENVMPDLILLDVEMPETDGYETIKKLKKDEKLAHIPVIFLSAKSDEHSELEGFNLGAVDYVSKPFSTPLLLKRVETHLLMARQKNQLLAHQAELEDFNENLQKLVCQKTMEVLELQNALLRTVSEMVEFRDKNTGGHIARTQRYLELLVNKLLEKNIYQDITEEWNLAFMLISGQLHDLGKIAVKDSILNKPDKLTPDEFETMKQHPAIGVDILEKIENSTKAHAFLEHARIIAGTHHEKWDGTGYPLGLSGENIPLEGRLMAIADVYDALISRRPYKEPLSTEVAERIIIEESGTHFDPTLIEVFRELAPEFAEIAAEENRALLELEQKN
jgi:putative two-component system response regulator